MTNVLLTLLVVLTALNMVLDGAYKLLNYFWPKSKVTKEVGVIRDDVNKAEGVVEKLVPPDKQSGRARLTLLAVVALLAVAACSLSMSCTAAQKKAVSNFGHCEETAAVEDLEAPVKTIGDQFIEGKLSKDSAMALLDSFAQSYGLDSVGCAAALASQLFSSKVGGTTDGDKAVQLYNEWFAKHGIK